MYIITRKAEGCEPQTVLVQKITTSMQILHFCISVNQKTLHHWPHLRAKSTEKKGEVKGKANRKRVDERRKKSNNSQKSNCQSLKYQHLESARDNCTFHVFSSSRRRKTIARNSFNENSEFKSIKLRFTNCK